MKSLSNYIEDAQSDCFKKHGIFFAFSTKQFEEQRQEGVKYCQLGMGLLCPKDNVEAFIEDHSRLVTAGIQKDIEENGIEDIIRRELENHEVSITYDITDTVEALKDYEGITESMIYTVFHEEYCQ